MLRLTRASVIAIALALLIPGVARATPIAFEFSGFVAKTGGWSGLAEGDPLTATLSYDTDAWTKVDDDGDHIVYSGGSFEIHAGPHAWSAYPRLIVWKSGDLLEIGHPSFDSAFASLEGSGLIPPGGAAPTSINLAAMTDDFVLGGLSSEGRLLGHFTGVVQTQGPGLVPAPEPATLTLSALGLVALLARRRTRVTRVWHAGGEVFHAATKAGP